MPWLDKSFDNMMQSGAKVNSKKISVGIVSPSNHNGRNGHQLDMAKLYAYQDLGTRKIPKRETLKPAIMKSNLVSMAESVFIGIANGRGAVALGDIGAKLRMNVKREIMTITSPALKESTLSNRRRYGNSSTKPLVDTKQLVNAIGYKVS